MTKPTRMIPMPSVEETIDIYNGKRKTIIKWGGKTYKTHAQALKDRQKFIDKLKSREEKNNGRHSNNHIQKGNLQGLCIPSSR